MFREKLGGNDRVMEDRPGSSVAVVNTNEKVTPGEPLDASVTLRLPKERFVVFGVGKVLFPMMFPRVLRSVY